MTSHPSQHGDVNAMRAAWEHSDRVVCVHPGWPILRTWRHVEDSWRRILEGPGHNQFILTNEAVAIDGDLAWVTLDENLVDAGGTGTVAGCSSCTTARPNSAADRPNGTFGPSK